MELPWRSYFFVWGQFMINSSVGKHGRNDTADTIFIQQLLNLKFANQPIRNFPYPLNEDGRVGTNTINAIRQFQTEQVKLAHPDSTVDKRGPTLTTLKAGLTETELLNYWNRSAEKAWQITHKRKYSQSVAKEATQKKQKLPPAPPASLDVLLCINPDALPPIAWGAHPNVSIEFKYKVIKICKELGVDPNHLMACMAFESVESFRPDIKNPNSSATGLIQFMDNTASALGTTTKALSQMTNTQQLDYVKAYFEPYKNRLNTLTDVYMAILCPRAIGQPEDYVVFSKDDKTKRSYFANKVLDTNGDGIETKKEISALVTYKLEKGLKKYLG